jgi:pyruvate formate lyase activating enzyme
MKEAFYYKKLKNKNVQCELCPRFCVIKPKERGNCGVRENQNGKLTSLVYSKPCAVAVDPIEKKPLFHFLPGEKAFSIGTVGCNLHCLYCQNYSTSQAKPEDVPSLNLSPKKVVEDAIAKGCKIIAYTYTEPTIFYEYMLDIAKIAKKKGIKNVIVSNGFINEKPLKELCKYIDAANIDLKSFDNEFYKKLADARIEPVLKSLKILKENKIWLEITNLLIENHNTNFKKIEEMCKWIKDNLGKEVPMHFSRFFPYYKMADSEITKEKTLKKAFKIAKKYLDYVYIGNIQTEKGENTYCVKCNQLLIERSFYFMNQNKIKNNKCDCGYLISGVWE